MKSLLVFLLLTLGIILITGCSSTREGTVFQKELDSLEITVNQVSLANRERAIRIANIVEEATDSICSTTEDVQVRQNARLWRISVVPAFRLALLYTDPVAALLDGKAFALQMSRYLKEGSGRYLFGNRQDIALRAARTIEMLFVSASDTINGNGVNARYSRIVEEWARQHPIESHTFDRESAIPHIHKLLVGSSLSIGDAVSDIAHSVTTIENRLNLYAAQLPREVRWQAEYVMSDLRIEGRLDSLQRQAASALASVDRLTRIMESGDLAIDIGSLHQLHDDIELLKQMISAERQITLDNVDRQRLETLQELQRLADRTVDQTSQQASAIIDHLTLRVAQLAGLLVVVIILCGVIFLRMLKTRRSLPA